MLHERNAALTKTTANSKIQSSIPRSLPTVKPQGSYPHFASDPVSLLLRPPTTTGAGAVTALAENMLAVPLIQLLTLRSALPRAAPPPGLSLSSSTWTTGAPEPGFSPL